MGCRDPGRYANNEVGSMGPARWVVIGLSPAPYAMILITAPHCARAPIVAIGWRTTLAEIYRGEFPCAVWLQQLAPIHNDGLTSDPRRQWRGEEHDDICHFLRMPKPPKGN